MMRKYLITLNRWSPFRSLQWTLLLISLFSLFSGCEELRFDKLDRDHTLIILNSSECDLRIHLDGTYIFSIPADESGEIENLDPGFRHVSAYKDLGGFDGDLVQDFFIDVGGYEDYEWVIQAC